MKFKKILLSGVLTTVLSVSSVLPALASPTESSETVQYETESALKEEMSETAEDEIVEDGPVYGGEPIDIEDAFNPNLNTGPEKISSPVSALANEETIPGWWEDHGDGKKKWVHGDLSYTTNGWEYIHGYYYYMDNEGFICYGWIKDNGNTYYCDENGHRMTGWVLIDGIYYFFANDGVQCFGWIQVGGEWYYMDPTDGHMRAGWITTNGNTYFCNASGVMVTGWFKLEDGYHYCNEDKYDGHLIDNTGTRLIQEALKYLGGRYVDGGNDLNTGVDCSGYVREIHKSLGITIAERSSKYQYNACPNKFSDASELQPGDLIWCGYGNSWSSISHVMFYVGKLQTNSLPNPGEGNFYDKAIVHAANPDDGICLDHYEYYEEMYSFYEFGSYWK